MTHPRTRRHAIRPTGRAPAIWRRRCLLARWKSFTYDELVARDKTNLDITWLRDESLGDTENLPAPEVIAREIVEDLTAALAESESVAAALEGMSDGDRSRGTH